MMASSHVGVKTKNKRPEDVWSLAELGDGAGNVASKDQQQTWKRVFWRGESPTERDAAVAGELA
jgi:hypothetical protein